MKLHVRLLVPVAVAAVGGVMLTACALPLNGTFDVSAGVCGSGGVTSGSYFRMIQPGGTVASGPFLQNPSSPCGDKTYTPLSPGTAGGLKTGTQQPQPSPAFDSSGNSLSKLILKPVEFFGVKFGESTNSTDPQTGVAVAAPTISNNGGSLSGDLRAFNVGWNNQNFNQGAPKPNGTDPGLTSGPRGLYNSSTGVYGLVWTSQIVGGPFNGFTGSWYLTGTFHSN
jgi:hypothetical protein